VSANFLAKLQKQYEQGKFTDVRVRCVILPDPKSREQGAALWQEQQNGPTDILCHANVLCARSPYFEPALGGEWNEPQTKTVEVVLKNEQAVQNMNLLIKLCYFGSYTKDAEELLNRSTRMRLAFLGNAFEMLESVWKCLESLTEDLTPANALSALDEVPEELRGHEAMPGVTAKVVGCLAGVLDKWTESDPPTINQKEQKLGIVNAVAAALGPVYQLLDQGKWLKSRDKIFYTCLPLKPHVLALPPTVMEAVLASDALHVRNEYEVYTLLGCWVHQSQFAGAYDG